MQIVDRLRGLIDAVPGLLEDTTVSKIVSGVGKRDWEHREADVKALAKVRSEEAALKDGHAAARAAAADALAAAEAAQRLAVQRVREVNSLCSSESGPLEHRRRQLETRLQASASPKIGEARRSLRDRYDRERHTIRKSIPIARGYDDNFRPIVDFVPNDRAIRALLDAVKAADARLEQLMLENPQDVDASIRAIVEPVEQARRRCDTDFDEPPRRAA